MDRILTIVAFVVFVVAFFVAARLWDRRRLRKAVAAHRRQIEAFTRWFDVETSHDREAIDEIHRADAGGHEVAWVYLKRGGFFQLWHEPGADRARFGLSIHGVDGCALEHFPPHGTRCDDLWFTTDMSRILGIIDVWPRPWTRAVRAERVAAGKPDPLEEGRP